METPRKRLLETRIPVRWGDMDALGHVNNAMYFRYMEQARIEWIEQLGFAVGNMHAESPVIINAACTFLIPITYPATVNVAMWAGPPSRSSFMTWYELRVDGDERLFAEGSAKIVWMNTATGRSTPIPEALRQWLTEETQEC